VGATLRSPPRADELAAAEACPSLAISVVDSKAGETVFP